MLTLSTVGIMFLEYSEDIMLNESENLEVKPGWLNAEGAAAYLKISRSSFDRQVKAGTGPKGSTIPNTVIMRWSHRQLDRWMDGLADE